ncbi:MAG: arginine deiminase-related protein [Elusimicrobiota bacterium]
MNKKIYAHASDLKGFSVKNCPSMPPPSGILMCPPEYYDVTDIRNPYMSGNLGKIDRGLARRQWEEVKAAFEKLDRPVRTIAPVKGLVDMVFAANQTLTGLTSRMQKVCMLGQMRHPVRRGEVGHFEKWFRAEGYRIVRLKDPSLTFEGMGDSLWHPGKRLLWGGYGFRTDPEVYQEVAEIFETPVVLLKLVNERFYHLATCFCPLTPEAALIYPPAFDPVSLELILKFFPVVLAVEEKEAMAKMPCSASVVDSTAVIQRGADAAIRHIRAVGLVESEVDTSEFIKSGASIFSLKMNLY